MHVLLRHHPVLAAGSTLMGITTVLWLIVDYRALGRLESEITEDTLKLRVGNRFSADIALAQITGGPAPAQRARTAGRVNVTKPSEPNVLLVFTQPINARVFGIANRPVSSVLLHVDQPEILFHAIDSAASS